MKETLHSQRADSARIGRGWLIFLGIFGLFVVGVVVLLVLAFRDERPPNVSDLQVIRVPLTEEQNAFNNFLAAATALKWPEGDEGEALQKVPGGYSEWNEESVATFLAQNAEALRLWEQGMAKGRLQAPEVKDLTQNTPYLSEWRSLARAAALKAMYEARTGQTEAAREDALRIVEFGHMIQESSGPFITFLVGTAAKAIGLGTVRDVAAHSPPDPKIVPELIARLHQLETDRQGLTDAYRMEYQTFSGTISGLASGNASMPQLPSGGPVRFVFKPNQTRRLYADFIRWVIQDAERPMYEPPQPPPKEVAKLLHVQSKNPVRLLVSGNGVGKVLIGMTAPAFDRAKQQFAQSDWTVRATQVFVALKSYEAANGELPETLDALVPDYLPEVPLDPFDGQPLKYSKEDRKIYTTDAEFSKSTTGTIVVP